MGPAADGTVGSWPVPGSPPWLARPMRTLRLSRASVVALTVLVALATAVPAAPVDARKPLRKIEPRFMTSYRIGRVFTPNTDILSTVGIRGLDDRRGAGGDDVAAAPRIRVHGGRAQAGPQRPLLRGPRHARERLGDLGDRAPQAQPVRLRRLRPRSVALRGPLPHLPQGDPRGRREDPRALPLADRPLVVRLHDAPWRQPLLRVRRALGRQDRGPGQRARPAGGDAQGAAPAVRPPAFADTPVARTKVTIEVPWKARKGAVLPAAIRFRVRWTPIALVEASARGPRRVAAPRWTFATRTEPARPRRPPRPPRPEPARRVARRHRGAGQRRAGAPEDRQARGSGRSPSAWPRRARRPSGSPPAATGPWPRRCATSAASASTPSGTGPRPPSKPGRSRSTRRVMRTAWARRPWGPRSPPIGRGWCGSRADRTGGRRRPPGRRSGARSGATRRWPSSSGAPAAGSRSCPPSGWPAGATTRSSGGSRSRAGSRSARPPSPAASARP